MMRKRARRAAKARVKAARAEAEPEARGEKDKGLEIGQNLPAAVNVVAEKERGETVRSQETKVMV